MGTARHPLPCTRAVASLVPAGLKGEVPAVLDAQVASPDVNQFYTSGCRPASRPSRTGRPGTSHLTSGVHRRRIPSTSPRSSAASQASCTCRIAAKAASLSVMTTDCVNGSSRCLTHRASAASDPLAPALPYVPPPAIGGWRSPERCPVALVGCMRWLGGAQVILPATFTSRLVSLKPVFDAGSSRIVPEPASSVTATKLLDLR
jgi:hypothetical protein